MASKTKPSLPTITATARRVTPDMIATPEYLYSVTWCDDGSVLTGDASGALVKWSEDGRRLASREMGPRGTVVGAWHVAPGRLLARAWGRFELLRDDTLETVAVVPDACEASALVVVGEGHVASARGEEMTCWRYRDDDTLEVAWRAPRPGESFRGAMMHHTVVLHPGALVASEWTKPRWLSLVDGRAHEVPSLITLSAVDRARGLAWGQRGSVRGVVALDTGEARTRQDGAPGYEHARFVDGGVLVATEGAIALHSDADDTTRWRTPLNGTPASMALSRDGRRVALGFVQRVLVLDVATGEVLHDAGPEVPLRRVGTVPSDRGALLVGAAQRQLVTAAREAARWRVDDGAYEGDVGAVLRPSLAGATLYGLRASAGIYELARLDVAAARPALERVMTVPYVLGDLAVSADGAGVFFDAYAGGGKWSWTLRHVALGAEGAVETVVSRRPKRPHTVWMSAGPRGHVAVGTWPDLLEVYEGATGRLACAVRKCAKGAANAAFAPDESWVVVSSLAKVTCASVADGAVRWASAHPKPLADSHVCVSPDGSRVLSGGWHARITVRRAEDGSIEGALEAPVTRVSAMAFGHDGALYVAGGEGHVWSMTMP